MEYDKDCYDRNKILIEDAHKKAVMKPGATEEDIAREDSDAIKKVVEMCQVKKENFGNVEYASVSNPPSRNMLSLEIILYYLLMFLIGGYAVYLSWTCNTAQRIDVLLKVVYAIFAFYFGIVYLIFYFVFRVGTCYPPK